MKVRDLSAVNALMGACVLAKMASTEKAKFLKARKEIKKAVADYDDLCKDAAEKLKPEGFDELYEKVQTHSAMTAEEVAAYYRAVKQYNEETEAATKEDGDADVELSYDRLTEDGFLQLVDSNDKLTVDQIERLEEALCASESK